MKKKKLYLEIMRVLCILTVLFCHRPAYHSTDILQPVTVSYAVKALNSIVFRCCIPMFFMISGILLLGRQEPVAKTFTKRIPRILGAMVIAYLCYLFCFPGRPDLQAMINPINWFFYAYLGFLLLLPIYRWIAQQSKKDEVIYLLILMFVAYTGYGVIETAGINLQLPVNILHYANLDRWPNELWALMFPLTGYLITHLEEKGFSEKERKIFWTVVTVLAVLSVIGAFLFYLQAIRTENTLMRDGAQQYFLFAPSCLIFEVIRRILEPREDKIPEKAAKVIEILGASVFGIFLIEVQTPFSWLIYEKIEPFLVPVLGPYFPSAVCAVVEFVLYAALISLLRLIPPVRRIL